MSDYGRHHNTSEALIYSLRKLLKEGSTIAPRGNETKELINTFIEIKHPEQRCYILPHRKNNIFAQIAETLWMLAGRNDIEWLSYYLPRAPEFSDNGKTWRGAYGPRLRNWNGTDSKVDQLDYVRSLLVNDPISRQAVISIWDPAIDTQPGKDIPCNNWIQFIMRNGLLNMNISQRSSDAIWGYSGIDTFSWSVLHDMMTYWVSADQGMLFHFIGSQHIYKQHYVMAYMMLDKYVSSIYTISDAYKSPWFTTPFKNFDESLNRIFRFEDMARSGAMSFASLWTDIENDEYLSYDAFLRQCAQMLLIYNVYKYAKQEHGTDGLNEYKPAFLQYVNRMEKTDFRLAALEFFSRYVDVTEENMAHTEDVDALKTLNIL